MFSRSKKLISMLIIFVIVFTYMGQTLEAVATTDGLSAITNGFFTTNDVTFSSYFEENGNQTSEKISDVNETATLILEVSPNEVGKGFLKTGTISANSIDGSNINFKFSKIKNITVDEPEAIMKDETVNQDLEETEEENIVEDEIVEPEENIVTEENVVEEENIIENDTVEDNTTAENTVAENTVIEENTTTTENITNESPVENTLVNEESNIVENEAVENEVIEQIQELETENILSEENTVENEVVSRSSESREENIEDVENQLINEEQIIEEVLNTEEETDELGQYQVDIISDNEIQIQTITAKTRIEVEIEFVQKDTLNVPDLYKEISLNLNGTYINVNLEEIEENLSQNIIVGWKYNKDIEVSSEYTKFSPYKVGEKQGSILENKIVVKRESEDEKYLPIKNTSIEIKVPTLNGEKPTSVSIHADKLMATKGQDAGEVEFSADNWNYNADEGILKINVINENNSVAVDSLGTDEYVVVYKYANFVEEGNYTFEHNAKITVEEYSANQNNYLSKAISGNQEITGVIGELISYSISTSEDAIGKGKINANYNSEVALYETEFTTTVNLNILTSDMFEELRIDSSKENYLDSKETAFEATDVYYKKVKFNYNEIKDILSNGGSIEILNNNNELLYTLNSDLITKQEDCEINLESKAPGIFVVLKNVTVNQNLSIEFTKAIQKSNYEKAVFNTFRKLESRVSATVKYADEDVTYNLSEIAVKKNMKSSSTVANISLDNSNLKALSENKNVEMKIELNNDKETSDLYINPSFEIVFPKYVKNVTVQNINVTYAGGLRIEDFQTYTENDIVKMRINLTGTQTVFSESELTHGTNILVTANITLDDYTPSKKDQIKMYYSNEGVTNYESQTKWTISKAITPGILRETNGFDVEVVNYQAPNGLVTSNAIVNYDGNLSIVKSIKQGEKLARIDIDSPAKVTTMELFVSNNTGNKCNNIVLLGRVPFKGNKDVITNQDLGTTVDTSMLSGIKEDITNLNLTTIYYSENGNATSDLSKTDNGWTTEATNWQNIKSYMIVVKGNLEAGAVLRYSYDFEIPANLDYSTAIFGSFGAYYNNNMATAIVAENSLADKVGLKTEVGIPIDIRLTADTEKNIGEGRFINYTVTVTSMSQETLKNIQLSNVIPEGTTLYEKSFDTYQGDNGYVAKDTTELQWTIDELTPGETSEMTYRVKVNANMAGKKISNIVHASMNDLTQKSNTNELSVKANSLNIEISKDTENEISVGDTVTYKVSVTNIAGVTEKNIVLKYTNPKELTVDSIYQTNEENPDYKIDTTTFENLYTIPEIKNGETKTIYITQTAIKATSKDISSKVKFVLEDGTEETSSEVYFNITSIKLKVSQTANVEGNTIEAGDEIVFSLNVKNLSDTEAEEVKINTNISEFIDPSQKNISSESASFSNGIDSHDLEFSIFSIGPGEEYNVSFSGTVKEDAINENISSKWKVSQEYINDIETDEMIIKIMEPKDKEAEENEVIEEESTEGMYSISGTTWVDSNNNGIKDEEDISGVQAEMQLLKDGKMIKATNTNSDGEYSFDGLVDGEYSLVANYNEEKYTATAYAMETAEENTNSKAYETTEGVAVTDTIQITNSNVGNLNIGLVEKDNFDFQITETIEKATVIVNGESKEYDYDDLELAKLEINPDDLADATVKIEYKIRIDNSGNVDGKVSSIVDYLPNGMYFIESDNPFWSLGTDGNIYYAGLKDTTITAGDFQEVKLVLQKRMTDDNTGLLSNKAKIAYTESDTRMVEAKTGNLATQETIVTVTQGVKAPMIVAQVSIIAIVAIFGYMIKTGYFKDKKLIKKIYR